MSLPPATSPPEQAPGNTVVHPTATDNDDSFKTEGRANIVDLIEGEAVTVPVDIVLPYGSYPDTLAARFVCSSGMRLRRARLAWMGAKVSRASDDGVMPDMQWATPVQAGILPIGALLRGSDGNGVSSWRGDVRPHAGAPPWCWANSGAWCVCSMSTTSPSPRRFSSRWS